jgi:hypothetical protein
MVCSNDNTRNNIIKHQQVTLLDLIDRLLDKGVVVKGEILLSVADIDLVYLSLELLLSSVKTVEEAARKCDPRGARLIPWQTSPQEKPLDSALPEAEAWQIFNQSEFLQVPPPEIGRADSEPVPFSGENSQRQNDNEQAMASIVSPTIDYGSDQILQPRANIDPKNVEKGLAKLVLTLVELIRKLMEKQAIRRIEAEQLSASEVERVGNAFFLLDEKMEQLKKTFGLEDEDLNLDLGPLGELL